jgi:hypothetical protein
MAVAIVSLVVGVRNIELPIFATVGVALCETIATLFRAGARAVVSVRGILLTAKLSAPLPAVFTARGLIGQMVPLVGLVITTGLLGQSPAQALLPFERTPPLGPMEKPM